MGDLGEARGACLRCKSCLCQRYWCCNPCCGHSGCILPCSEKWWELAGALVCSWCVQEGCTDGRFLSGAPKTGLQCQKAALPLQIHMGLFFFQWPHSWEKFCFLLKAQCHLKIPRVWLTYFLLASQKMLVFPGPSWTSLWDPWSDFREELRLCFHSARYLRGDEDVLMACWLCAPFQNSQTEMSQQQLHSVLSQGRGEEIKVFSSSSLRKKLCRRCIWSPMCASATASSAQDYGQIFWHIHLYTMAFQGLSRLEDTGAP